MLFLSGGMQIGMISVKRAMTFFFIKNLIYCSILLKDNGVFSLLCRFWRKTFLDAVLESRWKFVNSRSVHLIAAVATVKAVKKWWNKTTANLFTRDKQTTQSGAIQQKFFRLYFASFSQFFRVSQFHKLLVVGCLLVKIFNNTKIFL